MKEYRFQIKGLTTNWSLAINAWIATQLLFTGLLAITTYAHAGDNAPDSNFFSNWMSNVTRTQELQPHWESLIGMSSARLTQGLRYDYSQQSLPGGDTLTNYGMGKGLQLILGENFETQIGIPAYIDRQGASGWADESILLKYRFTAANEENGNYIVSGLLGLSIPTGTDSLTSHSTVFTPAIAVGKGWGTRQSGVDIQSSLSASLPDSNLDSLGIPVVWNIALQAHALQNIWPEIEASYTHWYNGLHDGKNQLVLTYGITFGRIEIKDREKLTFGFGYQEPVGTDFSTFSRKWVFTTKLSF